jgi:uncharacterized membrane protein
MNSKTRILLSRAGIVRLCERDRRVIQRVAQRANDTRAGRASPRRLMVQQGAGRAWSSFQALWPIVVGVPALLLAWFGLNLLVFSQVSFDWRLFLGFNLLVGTVGALQAGIVVTTRTVANRDTTRHAFRERHATSPGRATMGTV